MDDLQPLVLRIFSLIALVYGYALALREWGQGLPDELDSETRARVRRRAWGWTGAALLLLAVLFVTWGYALGLEAARVFISSAGSILLMQAFALLVLLPVGAGWAQRLGRAPLGGLARGIRPRELTIEVVACTAAMLGWTLLLKATLPYRAIASLPGRFDLSHISPALAWPLLIALLTLAPILEECFFRHYLLHRIAGAWQGHRIGPAVAMASNAILFGFAHYGSLEPFWLRFMQATVLGVMLSALAWRRGLQSSIAAHWLYNLGLAGVGLITGGK